MKNLGLNFLEKFILKVILSIKTKSDNYYKKQYSRSLPFNEIFNNRWSRANDLGFGNNSNIYDSSLVIGEVKIGKETWVGPFTILDGSGKLSIGDYCTISSGVHIYTHDNIEQTLSSKQKEIKRSEVRIGNNVYIGPNSIISKGVKIGDNCIIGALSFVNSDVPDNSTYGGIPAKLLKRK